MMDYVITLSDGERRLLKNTACFSNMEDYKKNCIRNKKTHVESLQYKPELDVDGDTAKEYLQFLLNEIGIKKWIKQEPYDIMNYGAVLPANLPGAFIVGIFSLLRYLDEATCVVQTTLELNREGIDPHMSLYLAHFFLIEEYDYNRNKFNTNHSTLYTEAVREGGHLFLTGIEKRMKALPAYNKNYKYRNVNQLFAAEKEGKILKTMGYDLESYSLEYIKKKAGLISKQEKQSA